MNTRTGSEVFIHPGFSKSGTTLFQQVLSHMETIYSVGKPLKEEHKHFKEIILGKYFPLDYQRVEKEWLKITKDINKKILLSNE